MYEELVKSLREDHGKQYFARDMEAADAIEELSKTLADHDEMLHAYRHVCNGLSPDEVQKRISQPRWISVEERLPEGADDSGAICENVWLLFDDGGVYPGWMNGRTEKVYYLNDYDDIVRKAPISRVKMWQQRPEPPKEET